MVQSLKYTATPKNIATAKPTKIFFLSPPPMVLIILSLSKTHSVSGKEKGLSLSALRRTKQ